MPTASGASTAADTMRRTSSRLNTMRARGGASSTTASRSGARRKSAEAALAPGEFEDRVLERARVEVGPQDREKNEPTVRGLPHQEVGEPLLPAGANDEVGIGDVGRVEIAAEHIGRDRLRAQASGRDVGRGAARGARDL